MLSRKKSLSYASHYEVIGCMIKSHQANFLPFFESHIAPFVNELVQSRIPSIRQAGVCFVDDGRILGQKLQSTFLLHLTSYSSVVWTLTTNYDKQQSTV